MTELLEQAIARLKTLPANEQDAIAAMILEELEDEIRWDEAFKRSKDALAFLAGEAIDRTLPFFTNRAIALFVWIKRAGK
jgi:hypothetical protein